MRDRQPLRPNRVLVTPENGSAPFYATIIRADEPVDEGTPLNKAALLSDPTAAALGLASNPTVNDAFAKLAQKQTISGYNSDFYLYATGQHPVLNPLPYSNYFYCKYLLMMHYFKDTLARSIGQEFALTGNAETISTVTTIYDGGNL